MLLGTRSEEQDVGPKATDIMSGVFEVFVNLTQVFAGDPFSLFNFYPLCCCLFCAAVFSVLSVLSVCAF